MRLQTLLLPVFTSIGIGIASAQAPVPVPILNPVFNVDQLSCSPGGGCNNPSITEWLCGPQTYVLKASTTQFKIAPAEGLYVAALGTTSATGSILQTLGATLQANSTYELKVTVGARADYPFTGYEAALMAGNVIVASSNKATPVGGSFVTDVITYSSGAAPAQLGAPLQIIVKSLGTGQVSVAAVTLNVE